MKSNLTIVIPIYNEYLSIPGLINSLDVFFHKNPKIQAEVIFVDDGSSDSSVLALKKIKPRNFQAKIIRLSKNYGSHAALRAGVNLSSSKVVTFLSADLQEPLENIISMYRKINLGFELVIAVRKNISTGLISQFFTKLYAFLMRRFVSSNFPKNGFDCIMFGDKIKKELNEKPEANSSIFLQVISFGFSKTEIEYERRERKIGSSKWKIGRKIDLVISSFVSFSHFPIQMVSLIGVALSILGFLWAGYIGLRAIISRNLNPGWPSLVAILMLGFGVTNISLGIISEYLRRTYDSSLGRKTYIIDEIINI
jgi:polyisoprenyl-phosphate glycosyltransferase